MKTIGSGTAAGKGRSMSDIRIKTCVLGAVSTNCYLVYNEDTREAVVVDPADNAPYILNRCSELGITPAAVLLTHGHFDHMLAAVDVRRTFHVKIYASETEDAMLADASLNLSAGWAGAQTSFHADVLLHDGDELDLIGFRWKVIETPGHTSGSVCYYIPEEEVLFAGDTLFCQSYGRTDLPTGSSRELAASILEKVFTLADDIMVYPGHGETTTIGYEKKSNPILFYR